MGGRKANCCCIEKIFFILVFQGEKHKLPEELKKEIESQINRVCVLFDLSITFFFESLNLLI